MLPNCMTLFNSKGGSGKTTMTAHHAVACASAGWRVLVVDLDPQGNQARVLGYSDDERYDGGQALRDAIALQARSAPLLMRDVRPRLDVIPGGPLAGDISALLQLAAQNKPAEAVAMVESLLLPYAEDYDLVLLDLPPATGGALHDAALSAAHYMVATVAPNQLSLDGLSAAMSMVSTRKATTNPHLQVLGLTIQNWDLSAKKSVSKFVTKVQALVGDRLEFIDPPVRASDASDALQKDLGLVSLELVGRADSDKRARLAWLKNKEGAPPETIPESMKKLAKDYAKVTVEINRRFAVAQEEFAHRLGEAS